MSAKAVTARFVVAALVLATVVVDARDRALAEGAVGGSGGGGSDEVGAWAAGSGPGGGVRPPSPGVTCTAWTPAADISPEPGPSDVGTVRMDERGVVWVLYFRDCEATRQFTWVPNLSPQELGQIAFDELVRKLPKPAPQLSPEAGSGGWVNFETWLAVGDPGVVSATASIPGLSATALARVSRVDWDPGDGGTMSCEPFGALPPSPDYTGPAPCGHTYQRPSVASATGSDDSRYHGSITLVWSASWTASNGAIGDLGEARSSAPFAYRVREIQTIGEEG